MPKTLVVHLKAGRKQNEVVLTRRRHSDAADPEVRAKRLVIHLESAQRTNNQLQERRNPKFRLEKRQTMQRKMADSSGPNN